MSSTIVAAIQTSTSGLTIQEVLADIPHDPAAITVYLMLAVSVAIIVRTGRSKTPQG